MKRIWAAVVLAALLGGATAVALTSFDDVPDAHTHAAGVRNAVERGWFQGYPDGSFRPDRNITPAQLATVLLRAYPNGLTRGEAATFLTGGDSHLQSVAPTTSTTTSTTTTTTTTSTTTTTVAPTTSTTTTATTKAATTTTIVCEDDQEYYDGECDDYQYDYDNYCDEDDDDQDGECDAYDDEYDPD